MEEQQHQEHTWTDRTGGDIPSGYRLCPFCRAYERVYGRKAHAASTGGASRNPSGISPNA